MSTTMWSRLLCGLRFAGDHGPPRRTTPNGRSFRRCVGLVEPLEPRTLLSAGAIELGPQTGFYEQPFVEVELGNVVGDITYGLGPYGSVFGLGLYPLNGFLLDTGANSILSAKDATLDLEAGYRTEGLYHEWGVAGYTEFDVSAPYRLDFRGTDGVPHTLPKTEDQVRILSSTTVELGGSILIGGVAGIVGMPAMAGRVTTLDMSGWAGTTDIFDIDPLGVEFSSAPPPGDGNRYSVLVDDRVSFMAEEGRPPDAPPNSPLPIWAPVPFMTGEVEFQGNSQPGDFLLDTGAQMSMISTGLAFEIGLDEDGDGNFDNEMFGTVPIGGVGGTVDVPVLLIDAISLPTQQGVNLVWRDTDPDGLGLEVLVFDIHPDIDGIFGVDLLTSGFTFDIDPITWEIIAGGAAYFDRVHLDFRNMMDGEGAILFDLRPYRAEIAETDGSTDVVEGGATDTYNVVLRTPPAANVTIYLDGRYGQLDAVDNAHPDKEFLVFTPSNWNVPQQVRVTAIDDQIAEGPHSGAVTHTVYSADSNYDDIRVMYAPANITEPETAEIEGRYVFYNDSAFDDGPEINQADDGAIAGDKRALLPGEEASFANYTSYAAGINGVMIDVAGLAEPELLDGTDFAFRVGNDDGPSGWLPGPNPRGISVRMGAGVNQSDRVTIVFDDGQIVGQWLEVTMLDTDSTGLPTPDVFYFGNAPGESGNFPGDAKVNAADVLLTRNNPRSLLNDAPIDFACDYNRDARVNATDMLIARENQTHLFNALNLITVPEAKAAGSATAVPVEKASASGARAVGRGFTSRDSLIRLFWQHELEQTEGNGLSSEEDEKIDRAADLFLAAFWL